MNRKDKAFIEKLQTLSFITPPPWRNGMRALADNTPDEKKDNVIKSMDDTRAEWTKSGKWARWEKGRKDNAAKNKPLWVKRGRNSAEVGDAIS